MEKSILLLGNPELYQVCGEVTREELPWMEEVKEDLKDTLLAFRKRYGVGRAIAAPQIGVKKRVIYRHLDTPVLSTGASAVLLGLALSLPFWCGALLRDFADAHLDRIRVDSRLTYEALLEFTAEYIPVNDAESPAAASPASSADSSI